MTKQEWAKIELLVDAALLRPEQERQAYIYQACKANPHLRKEVLQLLCAIKESEGWFDSFYDFKQTILHPD